MEHERAAWRRGDTLWRTGTAARATRGEQAATLSGSDLRVLRRQYVAECHAAVLKLATHVPMI